MHVHVLFPTVSFYCAAFRVRNKDLYIHPSYYPSQNSEGIKRYQCPSVCLSVCPMPLSYKLCV